MSSAKTSPVWLYFTMLANSDNKAKCDLCKATLSCKGGSSSNLRKHLTAKHPTKTIDLKVKFQRSNATTTGLEILPPAESLEVNLNQNGTYKGKALIIYC